MNENECFVQLIWLICCLTNTFELFLATFAESKHEILEDQIETGGQRETDKWKTG